MLESEANEKVMKDDKLRLHLERNGEPVKNFKFGFQKTNLYCRRKKSDLRKIFGHYLNPGEGLS